ncbi:MAG: dihydropteroate synthase [Chitinispirillales bacterium]|jgi:dihydropteroate synthase|nr:dihydropteroate synthase [Chitinispirillales bacterium]
MTGKTAVMGIVNVTADSFYDGGRYNTVNAAVEYALRLIGDGADIIDIGGSSSRPGAELLSADEEIERVVPVIRELMERGVSVPVSIDTVWSTVARAAIGVGASWINDISAGRIDSGMATAVAETGCAAVLMHSRKIPKVMQDNPRYDDVVADVRRELLTSVKLFRDAGVADDKIILDPGFGFAKSADHNIELMKGLDAIVKLGYPVLVGVSRKSMIGAITGRPVEERLAGTLAATAVAYQCGARIFRVHDVKETVDFLKVYSRLE